MAQSPAAVVMGWLGLPKGQEDMSTSSFNPGERPFVPAGLFVGQGSPKEVSRSGNHHDLQPFLRVSLRDTNSSCDFSRTSDDDLIAAAQGGDQHAFVELCERYSSYAKRKILGIVRNHEDAEDALQDTLLRAYTHLTSFRRSCKFSTWLTTIGVNSALMILRKRRGRGAIVTCARSKEAETPEMPEPWDRSLGPEEMVLEQEATLLVRQEVEKLQPSLRSVVDQYYGSESSLAEAAKALDISLSAAKSRLSRGRARLKASLAAYGIVESRK